MTIELVTILECALAEIIDSDMWFDIYLESGSNIDWQTCMEHDMKCKGLLEAYEIMTGKKIFPLQSDIKKELATA